MRIQEMGAIINHDMHLSARNIHMDINKSNLDMM